MEKPRTIILIGRSGCGKGTQADLLKPLLNDPYYAATGNFFRDLATHDTAVSKKVKKILDEGGLPLDELAIALLIHHIAYNLQDGQNAILDGTHRRIEEAEHFDNLFRFLDRYEGMQVILVDISREEAFKRLKLRARGDDNDDAINGRLDYYEERVVPVIEYYKKAGNLIRVDGERSVEAIHEDIAQQLGLQSSASEAPAFAAEPLN
jgi:adenylate kinase